MVHRTFATDSRDGTGFCNVLFQTNALNSNLTKCLPLLQLMIRTRNIIYREKIIIWIKTGARKQLHAGAES